jgi:hypothetical protein
MIVHLKKLVKSTVIGVLPLIGVVGIGLTVEYLLPSGRHAPGLGVLILIFGTPIISLLTLIFCLMMILVKKIEYLVPLIIQIGVLLYWQFGQ